MTFHTESDSTPVVNLGDIGEGSALASPNPDRFVDWQREGIAAARQALDTPFSWTVERTQTEYDPESGSLAEARAGWHPIANQFYLYWWSKRLMAGSTPDRADMDPMLEIPLICPHICIFEPTPRGGHELDWFCRLMGSHVEDALAYRLTGHFVSDFAPAANHAQRLRYAQVVKRQEVSHRCGPSRTAIDNEFGWVESLYVPVTDRRRETKAVMGVAIYQRLL